MTTDTLRDEFDAWFGTVPVSEFTGITAEHVWLAYQAGRAAAEADRKDVEQSAPLPDVLTALLGEFKKYPQLKSVIGREALIIRCVDAAFTAAISQKENGK